MKRIVVCIPNISEGRDLQVIQALKGVLDQHKGVKLLHLDIGKSANRTVFTFVGSPEAIGPAAFDFVRTAAEHIDMRKHKGTHPRMGATDVFPIVPYLGISVAELKPLVDELAERIGNELHIPIYLYEHSARVPERKRLADLRRGGYEALPDKFGKPEWKPDFGPFHLNARSGATVMGVRDVLIAYNINLNTRNVAIAREIAERVRESGRLLRVNGVLQLDENGTPIRQPGLLKRCAAIGWFVDEYDCVQVSTNVQDFRQCPLHTVFETVREVAAEYGVHLRGSEIIGMVPRDAILAAGVFYAQRDRRNVPSDEFELIELAVKNLGLRQYTSFVPGERIIEYLL